MFTIDTLVDTTAKTTKQAFAYIPNEDVRASFETLVDAQAAFTKTVANTTTDLARVFADQVLAQTVAKK